MTCRPIRLTIGFLCLGMIIRGQTDLSRAGNVLFQAPNDWQRHDAGGYTTLNPPGVPAGESVMIAIAPGRPLDTDFRSASGDLVQRARSRMTSSRIVEVKELKYQGVDYVLTSVEGEDGGKHSWRIYAAVHAGDQFESILYLASTKALFGRYDPVFQGFLAGLAYANLNAPTASIGGSRPTPPPQAAVSNSGPEVAAGIYVANFSRWQLNWTTHMNELSTWNEYYIFMPGHRVYWGRSLPPGGIDAQLDGTCPPDPKHCGKYEISGGKLRTAFPAWPEKQPMSMDYQPAAGSIRLGNQWFYKAKAEDGLRLDGTFGRGTYVNTSASGVNESSVAGDHAISFTTDGRFQKRGIVTFAGRTADVGASSRDTAVSAGTYRVAGYTLELAGNGRTETFTFLRFPREEANVIVIDGATYTRRK